MKTYLKKAFQLSDSGAKGLVKSIWSFFLYYVSFVPPMICVFLFADRLLHGIADQNLLVPVTGTHDLALWNTDKITGYDFYTDASYVDIASVHVK